MRRTPAQRAAAGDGEDNDGGISELDDTPPFPRPTGAIDSGLDSGRDGTQNSGSQDSGIRFRPLPTPTSSILSKRKTGTEQVADAIRQYGEDRNKRVKGDIDLALERFDALCKTNAEFALLQPRNRLKAKAHLCADSNMAKMFINLGEEECEEFAKDFL